MTHPESQTRIAMPTVVVRWMLVLVALALPFPGKVPVPVIWLAGLAWLVELVITASTKQGRSGFAERWKNAGTWYAVASFFLLILFYVAGLIWTENLSASRFELEKKSMLLLFPLLIFTTSQHVFDKTLLRDILFAFLLGLVIITIYDLLVAYGNYQTTGHRAMLYYSRLAGNHHPAYLSLYVLFALGAVGWFFTGGIPHLRRWHYFVLIPVALWLLLFVFLLSARSGFISLLLLIIMFLARMVYGWPVRRWLPAVMVLAVLLVVIFKVFSAPLAGRLSALKHLSLSEEEYTRMENPSGVVIRMISWRIAMEQIREAPLLGTGTGDYADDTRARIREKNLEVFFGGFKNAHNQYLQTAVTLGIPGLIALFLWLVVPLLPLKQNKMSWLHWVFVVLVASNLFTESMLEAQAGVLFVVFFHTVIYRVSRVEKAVGQELAAKRFLHREAGEKGLLGLSNRLTVELRNR
jgi:O-antigen ligase